MPDAPAIGLRVARAIDRLRDTEPTSDVGVQSDIVAVRFPYWTRL
jgi:hypothetical protein